MTAQPRPLLKLPSVTTQAGISVISPASFAAVDRFDGGIQRLRQLGFMPHLGKHTQTRGPLFFAG